jgi:hypothetical protein
MSGESRLEMVLKRCKQAGVKYISFDKTTYHPLEISFVGDDETRVKLTKKGVTENKSMMESNMPSDDEMLFASADSSYTIK